MFLTQDKISLADLIQKTHSPDCGGICTFSGMVRANNLGRSVKEIIYDVYEDLAEKVLMQIAQEAKDNFDVHEVAIQHRTGPLAVGECAIAIVVASRHRADAFQACRFVIEEVKKRVAIWKHEFYQDGTNQWIENGCA